MTDEQPQSQRHRTEQGEAFHDEPTQPAGEHVIHSSAIVPDEHGNTYIHVWGRDRRSPYRPRLDHGAGGRMIYLTVLATAYCLTAPTFIGTHPHPGTVAVDRRVIPLGSHLRIPGYGRGHAEDTGAAIKGRRIDVWFSSCYRARLWGVRRLRVGVRRA